MRVDLVAALQAPAATVFETVTAWRDVPAWADRVVGAEVVAREGDVAVIDFTVPILAGGRLMLECVVSPPREVVFAEVDRFRGRGVSGRLTIAEGDEPAASQVALSVDFATTLGNLLKRRRIESVLRSLVDEVGRRAAGTMAAAPTAGRHKVLEVVRRNGKLVVWMKGREFDLPTGAGGEP